MSDHKSISIFGVLLGSLGLSAGLVYLSYLVYSNFFPFSRGISMLTFLFLSFGLFLFIGIRNFHETFTNVNNFLKTFIITYFLFILWLLALNTTVTLFKDGNSDEFLMVAGIAVPFLFIYSLLSSAISLAYPYSFKYTFFYNLFIVTVLLTLNIIEFKYFLIIFPLALAFQCLIPAFKKQ